MIDLNFCLSSYLTFRYVVKPDIGWKEGFIPEYPNVSQQGRYRVKTARDVLDRLEKIVKEEINNERVGILLSSGIDSAILAALLPSDTIAYTIRFIAKGAIDESHRAAEYATHLGMKHKVIDVTWKDYNQTIEKIMMRKKAPLHAAELALYKAAQIARNDGIKKIVVGNGADSTFGGMDKLLSKDWTFNEFIERYTFLDPKRVLREPVSMREIYERYRVNNGINVQGFLKVVHGIGIIQMFENAIHTAGCKILAPFEELVLDAPLDLRRIRSGDTKYILRHVFRKLYPDQEIPEKIPFARPMDQWMADYNEVQRSEFIEDLNLNQFRGEQKWLIYNLERFLNLIGV